MSQSPVVVPRRGSKKDKAGRPSLLAGCPTWLREKLEATSCAQLKKNISGTHQRGTRPATKPPATTRFDSNSLNDSVSLSLLARHTALVLLQRQRRPPASSTLLVAVQILPNSASVSGSPQGEARPAQRFAGRCRPRGRKSVPAPPDPVWPNLARKDLAQLGLRPSPDQIWPGHIWPGPTLGPAQPELARPDLAWPGGCSRPPHGRETQLAELFVGGLNDPSIYHTIYLHIIRYTYLSIYLSMPLRPR